MKTLQKVLMAVLLLLGFMPRSNAAEIFKNDDLDLNFGGRIQLVGDMDLVTVDPVRDHFRVFLWDEEDRLFTSGSYQGYKWNFEVAFGGEAINSSNNQLNLLDASVDIPLIPDMVSAKIGQFKVPGNLESADYEGNLLFAEKSPIFNLFFNQGYDTGIALFGHIGNLDGQGGMVQGGPDVIQRYLPEVLNFPTPMFLRLGYNDGIDDDPFHPRQTGFVKPTKSEFAFHGTGYVAADSNAGHSEDLGLGGGYLSTFNANSEYGNVLISSVFNPYMGLAGVAPVKATYWQAGFDFQYRTPVGDTTFTAQGQVMAAQYVMTVPSEYNLETPVTLLSQPGVSNSPTATTKIAGNQYSLNIGGGELQASIGDNPWEVAGRFSLVIPDVNMLGTYTQRNANGTPVLITGVTRTFVAPIFTNSSPIYELTFPSITCHLNGDCKLVAETIFMINTPAVHSDDGTYLIAEMPGSANSGIGAGAYGNANGANYRIGLVPCGRMMFQLQF